MPTDEKTREAWMKALTTGKYQGCGHMRLLIEQVRVWLVVSPVCVGGGCSVQCACMHASSQVH